MGVPICSIKYIIFPLSCLRLQPLLTINYIIFGNKVLHRFKFQSVVLDGKGISLVFSVKYNTPETG